MQTSTHINGDHSVGFDYNRERIRIDKIAQVCHEVARARYDSLGLPVLAPWEDATQEQRESVRGTVRRHLAGETDGDPIEIAIVNSLKSIV